MDFSFHEDTLESLCKLYNTDLEKGLTKEQALKNMKRSGKNKKHGKIQDYTMCKRDGEFQHVLSKRLTVGDIITLKAPQVVPADIRVIEASPDCKVCKSAVTGESQPQKVSADFTHGNPLETENVVLAVTKMTTGSCTGMVVNVGRATVIGRLAHLFTPLE